MKNILRSVFIFGLFAIAFSACKKDENQIYFEGGNAPALTVSSTAPLVLAIANANNTALTFNWTNPNYQFTTGISSQNVTYTLQVDTTGSNFRTPQETAVASDLSMNLSVKDLNTMLTKLNLNEDVPHNVEFRLKSSLNAGSVALYSNVIKVVVTPYLDVAVPVPPTGVLYITGDATASNWTNTPPASQKFTKVSNTQYTITTNFQPGFYYKFLSTQNFWQPQYGGSSATGGDLGYNMGAGTDPSAIPTPAVAGTYKIDVNFKTGKYTVTKI